MITKEILEKAYNLKIENKSWQEIENILLIKVRTLRDNLTKAGYDIHNLPKKKKGNGCKVITDIEILQAEQLKKEGHSLYEISKLIGHPIHKLRFYNIHLIRPEVDRTNKYFIDVDYFNNIDTEAKAYFLGLIAADGCISKESLRIELQQEDCYILKLLRDEISPEHSLYVSDRVNRPNSKTTECLTLSSKYFEERLKPYGIIHRKSYQSTFLPLLNEEFMPHFIRGYFDGDGSVYLEKKHLRIKIIGNKGFITELVNYLNIDSKLHIRAEEYTLYFTVARKLEIKRLHDYMYRNASIYLTRKKLVFDNYYNILFLGLE